MKLENGKVRVQVQTVLYKNNVNNIFRSVRHFANAARRANDSGHNIFLHIIWGDASPYVLSEEKAIEKLNEEYSDCCKLEYIFFNKNTGTSLGHNMMAQNCESEFMLIINPDVVPAPDFFIEILRPMMEDKSAQIGIVEGRQTPIEHHKYYDPVTHETSWGSGACTLFRTNAYKKVHGYDADTFFMYCDDVDISWRIRLEGYKVIYCPNAIVFHDKRLDEKGKYVATETEKKLSEEARLLMAWKWSFHDVLENLIHSFQMDSRKECKEALDNFFRRKESNKLPKPIDPKHVVGDITEAGYGPSRY